MINRASVWKVDTHGHIIEAVGTKSELIFVKTQSDMALAHLFTSLVGFRKSRALPPKYPTP